MNPWLWDLGQAHRHELSFDAQCRRGGLQVELAGLREPAPAGKRRWLGSYRPTFPSRRTTGPVPRWARASAWTGHRMIACGCRLVRPALVADAKSEMSEI